jgi:putative transposase
MRKEQIVTGEYYHIYNRGVDKRSIFNDLKDLARFKDSIKKFNQIEGIGSLERHYKLEKNPVRALGSHRKPIVDIVAFCINPNHFHFILKQTIDGGIAKFMQKLLGGYTYYFNEKNKRSGSLFQGTFKSKVIKEENYFRKIFVYVNQNYRVHKIPQDKKEFIFSSDREYFSNSFDFVSKKEGEEILKIFNGKNNLKKTCDDMMKIIYSERGISCLEDLEELPTQ